MAGSGFYTNRLRCREILAIMREARFKSDSRVSRAGYGSNTAQRDG